MRYPERERRRIAALRRRRPELYEALSFLEAIAHAATELIPDRFDITRLPTPVAGFPPLLPSDFPLDEPRAADAFRILAEAFAEAADSDAAREMRAAVRDEHLDPRHLVRAFCGDDAEVFDRTGRRLGIEPELLANLAELATKPQFIAGARALEEAERLDLDRPGDRCPACGSTPDLALITSRPDAERVATGVCRLCETEWPVRRIRCLFCGNDDRDSLSYLQAEGEEDARVSVCDVCHRYLPVLDVQGRLEVAPAIERIALAHLDIVARQRGYRPPATILAQTAGRTPN